MGLIAKEPIERGTRLFSREIHTAGISGKSVSDIRSVCHNCLEPVGNTLPVVCRDCRIVSYCSTECLQVARSLHAIECKGMVELEKLRGEVALDIPRPSSWSIDYEQYWPPAHALLAARVINKYEAQEASDWISYVNTPEVLPPVKVKVFAQFEGYVRLLVPDHISDREIKQSLLAISTNASTVDYAPSNTMIIAAYNVEYHLLNHMCKPNCEIDKKGGSVDAYTFEDVKVGEEIGISFVSKEYYMNVRELRRAKLTECFGFDCHCYMCEDEMIPGTKQWLLEKQKSSLIAPWSFQMVRQTMVNAWGVLCNCDALKRSPLKCVDLLEASFETLKQVLDPRNAMFVLTAVTLFLRYCEVNEGEQAITIFNETLGSKVLESITEYGSRRDLTEIYGNMCIRLFQLEMMDEFHAMFQMTQQIHPRRPSSEALREELHLDNEFNIDDKLRNIINANRYGIPSELYEKAARKFVIRNNRQPTVKEVLNTCWELLVD